MPEGQGGASAPAARNIIRSPRDFWGGLALVLVGVFAVWASSDLPGMRGFAFGPGTAPRMFAYCLIASASGHAGRPVHRRAAAGGLHLLGPFGGAVLSSR